MRALVTGGAAGLGRALVLECQSRGMEVVIVDREQPAPFAANPAVVTVIADLGREDEIAELEKSLALHRPFDIAIMNAGINATGPFEKIDANAHAQLIRVNLVAPLLLTRFLIAADMINRGGTLIFISSLSHQVGYPGAAVYAATKDGIAVFARSIKRSLNRKGINVLTVTPGPLDTDHARLHAPPGSREQGRSNPARVARSIIDRRKRNGIFAPGVGTAVLALLGRWFPRLATTMMRRIIFAKFPH